MNIFNCFAIFALVLAAAAAAPQKIVGGSLTTISQYPSIVALLRSSDLVFFEQRCGGTIINERAILTAAHCIERFNPPAVRIRVGSSFAHSGGVVHNSAQFRLHPDYSTSTSSYDSDIAIIITASVITFVNNAVQPGFIAGTNYNTPDNASVWAAGWGLTSIWDWQGSEQLRHVEIWVVNLELCRQRYAVLGHTVTNNMLCSGYLDVGGRDQCSGDSGGPLYHNGVVVGICSWGYLCADVRYPGVNTRVSSFTNWIQANA